MSQSQYNDELRAIRYIQLRGTDISSVHETINSDIESLKVQLSGLISGSELDESVHKALKELHLREMTPLMPPYILLPCRLSIAKLLSVSLVTSVWPTYLPQMIWLL